DTECLNTCSVVVSTGNAVSLGCASVRAGDRTAPFEVSEYRPSARNKVMVLGKKILVCFRTNHKVTEKVFKDFKLLIWDTSLKMAKKIRWPKA
ncbi:hypothetical protein C0J52_22990, partial [Blattella germanica]